MAYVRTRLGRWYFEEAGQKAKEEDATIVLLHSLLCDGGMWRGQVPALRELGRVVVLDGPGHGRSEPPPPFTLEEHARALVDAFDELLITKAIIVGLSWGGMVAMRLALHRPERLRALVILDSTAEGTTLRERVKYGFLSQLALRVGLPPALVRRKVAPLMFSPRTFMRAPELVDELVRSVSGFSRRGLVNAINAVSIDRPAIYESLRGIRVPTLVGYGEDDVATPAHHSRRIASYIGGSSLVTFKGGGHLSALEEPDEVNRYLVPFVEENLSSPPAPPAGR